MVVGALSLSGCDFSVYSLPLPGGAKLGDNPYTVKVEFRDVLDLVPQSSVKVDDVTVGRVDDIKVEGYHAEVTLKLRRSVKLPDNAVAKIRQTSLLGEKFVSLSPPDSGAPARPARQRRRDPAEPLEPQPGGRGGPRRPLAAAQRWRRGPAEDDLHRAQQGPRRPRERRESVLSQLKVFMGQLDTNKDQIVRAIESLNRLAIAINKQKPSITLALDKLPRAVASINRQRDDLVKMLKALADLSSVATNVIKQSKTATVDSLQALAPTLTKLAEAGDSLPKALQVFLTYPFVDAVVGTNPAQARNLHMGDYTNLSIKLDLDLSDLGWARSARTCRSSRTCRSNVCNNPELASCVTDLLKTDPNTSEGDTAAQGPGHAGQQVGARQGHALRRRQDASRPARPGLRHAVCDRRRRLPTVPKLPLKVPSLSNLTKCLSSGKPLGAACDKVNPRLIAQRCAKTSSDPEAEGLLLRHLQASTAAPASASSAVACSASCRSPAVAAAAAEAAAGRRRSSAAAAASRA